MQWWGPEDFTMNISRLELRPGGLFHYGMRSPDGHEMWGRFAYIEVVTPEKLVFTNSFSDEAGGITRNPKIATWPLEIFNICTFTESAPKTTLIMRGRPHHPTVEEQETFDEHRADVKKGFIGTFEQLDCYLASIHK